MQKLTIRFTVAFITFIIGMVSVSLWIAHYNRPAEEMLPVRAMSADEVKSNIPQGWHRIDVEGKFSFYLPPDMKRKELGAPAFDNKVLTINYGYGETVSCETEMYTALKSAASSYQSLEISIDNRSARQISGQLETNNSKWFFMDLCSPDIGDGRTRLYFGAGTRDERSLETAKQIMNTIEFR